MSEHAEKLKQVIKYGAPRIELKLRESEHVHFAQFLFIENDTKLALFTVYDRDFDSYIEHFALKVGPLFDRIFEHIEDAPPMPVNEFPKEFVDTIRRYNAPSGGDYFFSAYRNERFDDHPSLPEGGRMIAPPVPDKAEVQRLISHGYDLHCSRHFILCVVDPDEARLFLAELADRGMITHEATARSSRPAAGIVPEHRLTYRGLEKLGLPKPYLRVFQEKAKPSPKGRSRAPHGALQIPAPAPRNGGTSASSSIVPTCCLRCTRTRQKS